MTLAPHPRAGRSRTVDHRYDSKRKLAVLLEAHEEYWRPSTRDDCLNGPRPCPYVGCRWHLYLDAGDGRIRYNYPGLAVEELTTSCALDVVDGGPVTLDAVATLLNVTRERIRQIQARALYKLNRALRRRRDELL